MSLRRTGEPERTGDSEGFARGLGPLASGVFAAGLVILTLWVAVALGMQERELVAGIKPTPTNSATLPAPSATPLPTASATPSPTASATPLSPTAVPTSKALPTLTSAPTSPPTPARRRLSPARTPAPRPCRKRQPPPGVNYTVKRGDTLYSLATQVGSSVYKLMKANCLTNANRIYAGQKLWLPSWPSKPTRTPKPATRKPTATPPEEPEPPPPEEPEPPPPEEPSSP